MSIILTHEEIVSKHLKTDPNGKLKNISQDSEKTTENTFNEEVNVYRINGRAKRMS